MFGKTVFDMSSEYTYEKLYRRNQQLEDILKSNESINSLRFKTALRYSGIGIFEWDITRNELIWDDLMYEFWGITPGTKLTIDAVLGAIYPGDRETVRVKIDELSGKRPEGKWNIQLRVTGVETGILRWLEFTGNVDCENDKVVRIIGTAVDITGWKSEEEDRKKWENIFRNARWGTAVVSVLSDTFELINPEYASMHGYTVEELTGQPITTVFAPETRGELLSYKSIVHDKGHFVYDSVHIRKDGSRFPVNIDITTVYDEAGIPTYRIISVTDISERKKAEESLRESKDHFELLFNLNPDAVNIIRVSDSHIVSVNNGFTKLLGYTPDEVVGNTTVEVNLWTDTNERTEILNKVFSDGFCDSFEAHFRCKDGHVIVGIVSARLVDIYGSEHILTVTRDISLRKQFETALRESEKILKESQKIAGLGSYKLDFLTSRWESSEILDSLFGIDFSYDKSVNGWIRLVHPQWQTMIINYWQDNIITKKERFDKEYKIIRWADKKELWVHGRGELFFDEDGTLHYMTGTVLDITDRKKAEIIIQTQNEELIKLNATKDMLFSIIAHDLRSPLGSLMYSQELLCDSLKEGDITRAEEWCSAIKSTSNQTYDLLENLLDWFRVQTGQMSPEFSEYDLKSIVDEVIALFSENIIRKKIVLMNNITGVMPVLLDREITKTIIRNLINNAIKFTPESGSITVNGLRNTTNVEITVSDSGVGINEDAIPGLFSIITNKSTPGTDKERGSGLGLNICKDLVEIQGGTIWVESRLNKGSVFHFTIPLTKV
jgi:PAS domain S-box-containing protein